VALLAALAVVAGVFVATPAAQADCDATLCLALANIPGQPDKLEVTWTAKDGYRGYTVVVSGSRIAGAADVRYDEGHASTGTQMRVVVDHAPGSTPASGGYTYVRLIKRGSSISTTRWQWQVPTPIAPPSSADKVKIATFNVRTWGADRSQRATNSWTHRRAKVVKTMLNSGAGLFLLQETSGSPKLRVSGRRWQYQDLLRRMPDRFALTRRAPYTYKGRITGGQGNRIIYDTKLYSRHDTGYFQMPTESRSNNRWVPWALMRKKSTGAEFYVMAAHFKSGDNRAFRDRQLQAARMVSKAQALANRGNGLRTVLAGGDFNSTSNTMPYNGVHRTFANAGFYDGFATHNRVNGAYPTSNQGFRRVGKQPFRRDYLMSLNGPQGSYGFKNHVDQRAIRAASDHFMQSATFPVTSKPY
jgi:endonuclease/exonuclease/phosphatase family metal-dependent hydrolase